MSQSLHVLLISGSLREGSTNTAILRTANELAGGAGVATTLYGGIADLPTSTLTMTARESPCTPPLPNYSADRRGRRSAPVHAEYAGALPGALKNLLEWTVGDGGTYRKPIAWINASGPAAPTGGADAPTPCARCSATCTPTSSKKPARASP